MKMITPGKKTMVLMVCSLAAVVALATSSASISAPRQIAGQKTSMHSVLQKAHDNYYVLQTQGLKGFQVNIEPNWKQFNEDMKKSTEPSPEKIAALSVVQCSVVVDGQGAATVTPYSTAGGEIDHQADQSVAGLKQMVQGFFQTWGAMVYSSVFPEPGATDFSMVEQPNEFDFTGSGGSTGQTFALTKDSQLVWMKVISGGATIIMQPKFTKTDKGLLLTSIASDINNGTQKITIQIQNQAVQGFQLPSHVWFKIEAPNQAPILVDMAFTKYQISK